MLAEQDGLQSEVFNVAPRATFSVRQWGEAILAAADCPSVELVRVRDPDLPADLWLNGDIRQHLVAAGEELCGLLGWSDDDPWRPVADSVQWHLSNPPHTDESFEEDDGRLVCQLAWHPAVWRVR